MDPGTPLNRSMGDHEAHPLQATLATGYVPKEPFSESSLGKGAGGEAEAIDGEDNMRSRSLCVALTALCVSVAAAAWAGEECERAENFATNALSHAKRLYYADSMEDASFYAGHLLRSAQDTLKAASRCDCPEAEAYAEETTKYARKAQNAQDLEQVRIEAENAMGSAEDALKAAVACSD